MSEADGQGWHPLSGLEKHKLIALKAPAMRFGGESVNHLGTLVAWSAECECGWDSVRTASPEDARREHHAHLVDCRVAPSYWSSQERQTVPVTPELVMLSDIQEGDIYAQVVIQGPEFAHLSSDIVLLVGRE